MRRTLMVAAVVISGIVAGCGSSSSSTGTATAGSVTTGAAGSVGKPKSGKYNAMSLAYLARLQNDLVKFFTLKGFHDVSVHCRGITMADATCRLTGSNSSGKTSSSTLAVVVNRQTGKFHISHVTR